MKPQESCNLPFSVHRARPLLGTFVDIRASGLPIDELHRALDDAFAAIERVQQLMSFHDRNTDLARLNRGAFVEPVRVDPWTYEVLSAALRVSSDSEGAFDCTIGDLLVDWDFLPDNAFETVAAGASFRNVTLGPDHEVYFTKPLLIDLGGIAKGFAVDKAVEKLSDLGVTDGVVNAGGDLRVFGGRTAPICVRAPGGEHGYTSLGNLRNQALATSSPAATTKSVRGRNVSPLIDGVSRNPVTGNISISACAPTCMIADAMTKVVLSAPEYDWVPLLEKYQTTVLRVENEDVSVMGAVHDG